jgi:hypothetical protein
LGGVSCGTAAACYLMKVIYSDLDMKHFYRTCIRRFYEKKNRKYYGLISNGSLIKEISRDFWEESEKTGF